MIGFPSCFIYRNTGSTTITVRNTFSYDHMDRLKEIKQSNNGGSEVLVGKYEYNSMGQLVDKKLHSTNAGTSFLQSVDLRYNIRGQLTSINNSGLTNDGVLNDESNDVFGMELLYDKTDAALGNTANYTGFLSAVKWSAKTPVTATPDERGYLFSYDKLYRLTAATYKAKQYNTSTWNYQVNGFNETMTYDQNGNILGLARNAVISGATATLDNLSYDYGSGNDNNRLSNVTESSTNADPYGFRNFTGSSSGYSYDANGNLGADAKKGITIEYNELNKTNKIIQTSTGKYVQYRYDAAGIRISKWVWNGSTLTKQEFIGGFVFDATSGTTLSYFSMAEGRVRNDGGTLKYEYFISDHQGNVRLSFEDNGSGQAVVKQENSYYPFGMIMPGGYMPTAPNKNLYNAGSEWQDEFGGVIDYFSTFFREYDPVLGRFNGVDPKAEVVLSWSVYTYAYNNPVNFNDPLGDIARAEFNAIVQKLLDSPFGGQWSASTNAIAYYGDAETADIFGGVAGGGNPIQIGPHGIVGVGGSDDTKERLYGSIYNWMIGNAVMGHIKAGKVGLAINLMISAYPDAFGGMTDYYDVVSYAEHPPIPGVLFFVSYTKPSEKVKLAGTTELIWRVHNKDLTFGDVFRYLYHEFDHIQRDFGLNGKEQLWGPSLSKEREFLAYFHMFDNVNPTWPQAQIKTQVGSYIIGLTYYTTLQFYSIKPGYANMAYQMVSFLSLNRFVR